MSTATAVRPDRPRLADELRGFRTMIRDVVKSFLPNFAWLPASLSMGLGFGAATAQGAMTGDWAALRTAGGVAAIPAAIGACLGLWKTYRINAAEARIKDAEAQARDLEIAKLKEEHNSYKIRRDLEVEKLREDRKLEHEETQRKRRDASRKEAEAKALHEAKLVEIRRDVERIMIREGPLLSEKVSLIEEEVKTLGKGVEYARHRSHHVADVAQGNLSKITLAEHTIEQLTQDKEADAAKIHELRSEVERLKSMIESINRIDSGDGP